MTSRKIVFKPQWPILLSGETIRKEWLGHYRAIEKKLFKLKREWNAFETEAQTEYQSWYHQRFASEVCIIKLLEDECRELTLILSAVEEQIQVNGMTKRNAFIFVMQAMQEKRDPFPTEEERKLEREERRRHFQEQFKAAFAHRLKEEVDPELLERARSIVSEMAREKYDYPPRTPREAQARNQELTQALHEVYEDLKYDRDHSRKEPNEPRDKHEESDYEHQQDEFTYSRHHQSSEHQEESYSESFSTPKVNASDGVKALYRKIVRALHPDRGHEMTPTEKDLWSQTQTAYQQHDRDALRLILLRLEGTGSVNVPDLDSIAEIIDLTRALEREYQEVKQHKNRIKKDTVYRFWASRSKPKNRKILETDLDKSLRQQIFNLRGALRELNSEMGQFQRRITR